MSNRLLNETSPYLLQHSGNPVNWYPWCEEAFQKAKDENKPVFLSIGYSTCHWCHVMERESFEDEETAEILNENFISVKVDREERPDIDSIYLSYSAAFTGGGGWPASIFTDYKQTPFFAGSYYQKETFKKLLKAIAKSYKENKAELFLQSEKILSLLKASTAPISKPEFSLIDSALSKLSENYDSEFGGFSDAPKFPSAHNLIFLMDCFERNGSEEALKMAEKTLSAMYSGGLFDHIGYGFSRYSTDRFFLVPHFEKMLYDNALLIRAYAKAYEITGKKLYLEIAEKTAFYLCGELMSPEGAFYSAQDADSDGVEGKYYLLTPSEISAIIGKERVRKFNEYFDITENGNFEGKNIPNLMKNLSNTDEFDSDLPKIREYRKKRTSLYRDDKILSFWNLLSVSAFCDLYRVSRDKKYLSIALKTFDFIEKNLINKDTIYVSLREDRRGKEAFIDSYAAYIDAALSLYGAVLDSAYLERAKNITEKTTENFFDNENGGFYFYENNGEKLILRPKETYDGALPSGNSVMMRNLIRLGFYFGEDFLKEEREKQLSFMCAQAERYPAGYCAFLSALCEYENPVLITAVLKNKSERGEIPFNAPLNSAVKILEAEAPGYPLKNNKSTFYVCRGKTCLPAVNVLSPANNISKIKEKKK